MTDQKLELAEAIDVLEGPVRELKDFVDEKNFSPPELEQLLEAEKNKKDRKTAKKFLRIEIEETELDQDTDEAEDHVSDIEKLVYRMEENEDAEVGKDLEETEMLKALNSSIEGLEKFLTKNDISQKSLEEMLEKEKAMDDRKGAVQAIKDRLPRKKVQEDILEAEEDVEKLRRDFRKIKEDSEDLDRENVDKIKKMEQMLQEEKEQETETEPDEEFEEDSEKSEEDGEDLEETEDEETEDENEEKTVEDTETDENEDSEEDSGEESDSDDEIEDAMEELEDEKSDLEKKRELAEDLEVDFSEEDLQEISLEELEALKKEKKEREELIEDLSDDFDEEDLRTASTSDLKKLKKSMNNENTDESEDDDEKEAEDIKEEAEEDLEMLMGAVGGKSKEDDGESLRDKLSKVDDIKGNVTKMLHLGSSEDEEEEKGKGINDKKVLQLLKQYEDLEPREAAIKTAHIMKGYLEFKENMEKERTYKQLTDEIDDRNDESMKEVLQFFLSMHKDQYTGNINESNVSSVLDSCEDVVKRVY